MTSRVATVAVILAAAIVWGTSWAGSPDEATLTLTADPIHPDVEAKITFKASVTMRGVERLELSVGGKTASARGGEVSLVAGPFKQPGYRNRRLSFSAVATLADGSEVREKSWVYIVDPAGHSGRKEPKGTQEGYPRALYEQTGASLFRLDRPVVTRHARKAVLEYANDLGTNYQTVAKSPNLMVAAVAMYVDKHMGYRKEAGNRRAFQNAVHPDPDVVRVAKHYDPGGIGIDDFPQPADLTLEVSGDGAYDFRGDCEDFAILRAALLRALGFAPSSVWIVLNDPPRHEYNLVLYEGAYRIMDYGDIDAHTKACVKSRYKTRFGWNEDHGPRGIGRKNWDYVEKHADNYPGGKDDGKAWGPGVYCPK